MTPNTRQMRHLPDALWCSFQQAQFIQAPPASSEECHQCWLHHGHSASPPVLYCQHWKNKTWTLQAEVCGLRRGQRARGDLWKAKLFASLWLRGAGFGGEDPESFGSACQRLHRHLWPICEDLLATREKEEVPDSSSSQESKPHIWRDLLFPRSIRWALQPQAPFQRLRLWPIHQPRYDWGGGCGQPLWTLWSFQGGGCLEGYSCSNHSELVFTLRHCQILAYVYVVAI